MYNKVMSSLNLLPSYSRILGSLIQKIVDLLPYSFITIQKSIIIKAYLPKNTFSCIYRDLLYDYPGDRQSLHASLKEIPQAIGNKFLHIISCFILIGCLSS